MAVAEAPPHEAPLDIATVAVVDDDYTSALAMSGSVIDAGFEPSILPLDFADLDEVVAKVSEHAQAAVFDHRLSYGGFAPFTGAQAIAALYEHRIPGMLVTTFTMDVDVSIREVRDRVPVLVERRAIDGDAVREGILRAAREIAEGPDPSRTPRRVLVRIESISDEAGHRVADAVVGSWDPNDAIRFPLELLPEHLRTDPEALPGRRLTAMVNIGARDRGELYLRDFELLEPPTQDLG
jgi:hypothetical protein